MLGRTLAMLAFLVLAVGVAVTQDRWAIAPMMLCFFAAVSAPDRRD